MFVLLSLHNHDVIIIFNMEAWELYVMQTLYGTVLVVILHGNGCHSQVGMLWFHRH